MFGHKFRMMRNNVLMVDGKRISSRAMHENELFDIRMKGAYTLIMKVPKCKLEVIWYNTFWFQIKLDSRKWHNRVKGICGNFNGNHLDDMVTRNGLKTKDVNIWGNSYLAGNDHGFSKKCPATALRRIKHPCRRKYRRYVDRVSLCGAFRYHERGPFAKCLSDMRVKRTDLYEDCRLDTCKSGVSRSRARNRELMRRMSCIAWRNLAKQCEELDLPFDDDWEDQGRCKVTCPTGMTFQTNADPCPTTCQKADNQKDECRKKKRIHGCRCPPGLVQNGRRCIKKRDCPSKEKKRGAETSAMHKQMMAFMLAMKRGRGMPNNMLGAKKRDNGPTFNWNQQGNKRGGVRIPNVRFNFNFGGKKKIHLGLRFTVQNRPFIRLDNGELLMVVNQGRSMLYPRAKVTNFGTRLTDGGKKVRVIPHLDSSIIGNAVIRNEGKNQVVLLNNRKVILKRRLPKNKLVRIPEKSIAGQGFIVTLAGGNKLVVRIDKWKADRTPTHVIQILSPVEKVNRPVVPILMMVVGKKVIMHPAGSTRINRGGELLVDGHGREFVALDDDSFIQVVGRS
jgi:hypothetical protein